MSVFHYSISFNDCCCGTAPLHYNLFAKGLLPCGAAVSFFGYRGLLYAAPVFFFLRDFWLQWWLFFSSQTVLDPMFIAVYNLFYTSMPVLALGIFDQDVNSQNSLAYPKLYTPGLTNGLFNKLDFFRSALHGFVASGVLFFIPYGEWQRLFLKPK